MNFLEKYRDDFAEYDAMERDFIDDGLIWTLLNKWENPKPADPGPVGTGGDGDFITEPGPGNHR